MDANTSIYQVSEDLYIKMPEVIVSGFVCEALGIWDIIPKTGESIRVVLEKEEEHEEYTEDQGDRQNQNQKEKNQIFQIEVCFLVSFVIFLKQDGIWKMGLRNLCMVV